MAALHFILDVKNADDDQRSLLLSLRLQEITFYTWGEQAGLIAYEDDDGVTRVKPSSSLGQSRTFVLELLAQVQHLFEEFQKKERQRPEKKQRSSTGFKQGDQDESFVQSSNEAGQVSEKKRRWLQDCLTDLPEKTKHGWKSVMFASWDKGELEKLIKKFKELNHDMTTLLDSKLQTQIAVTTQDTYRVALQMAGTVAQIQRFIDAIPVNSNADIPQDLELIRYRAMAQFKTFILEQQAAALDLKLTNSDVKIYEAKDEGDRKRPYRSQGRYIVSGQRKMDVWIEWRDSGRVLRPGTGSEPTMAVLNSVKQLARLLHHDKKPREFRVPHCLGYYQSTTDQRMGFVFERPGESDPYGDTSFTVMPRTMLQLILQTEAGSYRRPGIVNRFTLAKALSNSLMYLHTVDWFHKALRSDNILFFTKSDSDTVDYGDPTISGFDVARPAANTKDTQTPDHDIDTRMYRHPESLNEDSNRPSYCKTFDIYSLGVILVELAFWMPIDKVLAHFDKEYVRFAYPDYDGMEETQKKGIRQKEIFDKEYAKSRPARQKAIRSKLLRTDGPTAVLPAIESEMGTLYMEVVRCCLMAGREMGAETDVPWTDAQGQPPKVAQERTVVSTNPNPQTPQHVRATVITKAYIEKVVRKLEEIKI